MTSRLIIKNLPKSITEDRLRKIISVKGNITDVRLQYTEDGVFRRFAFIGFESDQMASDALSYFNGTFIDTSRIIVQPAMPPGDPNIAPAWSKYSKKTENLSDISKTKFSSELTLSKSLSFSKESKRIREGNHESLKSSKKSVFLVESKKPGGKGHLIHKSHHTYDDDTDSDTEYQTIDYSNRSERISSSEECPNQVNESIPEIFNTEDLNSSPSVLETGRLFIRNLHFGCTDQDIKQLFEAFGPLCEVSVPISKETHMSKGFAYVTFMIPENAINAQNSLDGKIFKGRLLHLIPANDKSNYNTSDIDKMTFKDKKDIVAKKLSESDHNWNSLFLRPDTMMDAIAEKIGVSKSQIMDLSSSDIAVKVASAETHLIQETKDYLELNGISLEAFKTHSKRSDKIILVKNIPFSTTFDELKQLFCKYGTLGRIALPQTKSIVVIEFLNPEEAKSAFRGLAYYKFKKVPLYLEWAPENLLNNNSEHKDNSQVVVIESDKNDNLSNEEETLFSSSLHLKNLSFNTTEQQLNDLFSSIGEVRSVKISTRNDFRRGALSQGYGFLEFKDVDKINEAIDRLQGYILDGHSLVLSKSKIISTDKVNSKKKNNVNLSVPSWVDDSCCKLIIRNIPFEATEKDIKELFKSFSMVKSVRLPRRYDKRHRGFGFIEFNNHEEALSAFKLLSSTHIYGRHLVLEWAKTGEKSM